MYCGMTGKKFMSKIFIGPTYYMRLKHMVYDKIHSRSSGPRQRLTRQPPDGKDPDIIKKVKSVRNNCLSHNKVMASHRVWWQHLQIAGKSCI